MIVVADTSVLLNLAFLELGDALETLFDQILIPEAVASEFSRLAASRGRFGGLVMPACCRIKPVGIHPSVASNTRLDAGEAEALSMGLQETADAVLLDEINAREAAKKLRLPFIGTLGLLITAKRRGLIPEIAPPLRRLIVEAQFRIATDLIQEALKTAGELS